MNHPLEGATLREVEAYPWPDPDVFDVSHIRDEAGAWAGEFAILGGEWSPFWHDAGDLLGPDFYMRLVDDPEVVEAVFRHVVDVYETVSRRSFEAARGAIDVFFIGNDFGTQTGPIIGPGLFARRVLPHLARLIDLGHEFGLRVMLHCCGGYEPLIPSLIAAGLDGLHAIQPCSRGMDLRRLKAEYGERILLNGAIDSQHVLIEGDPVLVRAKTREVLEILKPGGGYVAGASHDTILEETPLENVLAMFDAIREFGSYGERA
jgi:uroporphyrinogen decarboxylase